MAQAGGIGVIHRNSRSRSRRKVRKVKKFEAGMVVNPVTIEPDETLADALELMAVIASPASRSSSAAPRGSSAS